MMADKPIDSPFPDDTLSKGWRFELHMEKVKKSDTWLRARTGFVRAHLLLLWSEAWEQTPCGTLPNDDELVALLLDMDAETFAKHRAILMRGWSLASNGRLYHETITDRVLAMLEKRAKDAQRTAASRARRNGQYAYHDGVTNLSHVTHDGGTGEFDTKHQAPSTGTGTSRRETPPKAPRKRRATAAAQLVSVEQLVADGVPPKCAADWLAIRAEKNVPLTGTAWETTKEQAVLAGMSIGEAVKHSVDRGRAGFRFSWLAEEAAGKRVPLGPRGAMTDERRAAAGAESTAEAAKLLGFTDAGKGEVIDATE